MVSTDSQTTLRRVIEDWGRHWSSHDLERLLLLFTDDVVYEDVPMGTVSRGKDEVQAFCEAFFMGYPDGTVKLAVVRVGCRGVSPRPVRVAVVPRLSLPAEIIGHAVWLYFRFSLSLRDVEELLAERGVTVTYETIRAWCSKFGPNYAAGLRRRGASVSDKMAPGRGATQDQRQAPLVAAGSR